MSRLFAVLALSAVTVAASPTTRLSAPKTGNGWRVPVPSNPVELHPRIKAAIAALAAAQAELKAAPHDFEGHRVEALKAIDVALVQLNICLKVNK